MRLFLLLTLALSGCGVSQELYDARTTELDRCRSDMTKTQAQLTSARARIDEEAGEREHAASIEAEYLKLKQDLNATEKQLAELREARKKAEARAEVYLGLSQKLKTMTDARTVSVEQRQGRMLIRVPAQLLFDPGRADLHSDAGVTLKQIAAALKEIPGRDFLVGGYTDAQLAKTSTFKSNWDLSTARAVVVTRVLQQEGVDPRHLAAAGYSEFVPLVDAPTSPAEHALNDRIEVTVMPLPEELPTLPDTAAANAPSVAAPMTPPPTVTPPASAAPAPARSSPAAAPPPPPGTPPR